MSLKTLFSAQAADGNSVAFKVREEAGQSNAEKVLLHGYGTWSGVSLHVEVCASPSASPQVWDAATQYDLTAVTFTDDFTVCLDVPSGTGIRGRISGTGSPVPSITLQARGDLVVA